MFQNYIKIALRQLWRYKGYSFLNIFGLAVGLGCCILIMLYVRDELSYDRFHNNSENIYRITSELKSANRPTANLAATPPALGPVLKNDFPEISAATRLKAQSFFVSRESNQFYEDKFYFADEAFLDIFTFPLENGNAANALSQPFQVILTRAAARKYFGQENPLGKSLILEDTLQFTVSGVFANIPTQSHLDFDFIASFESLEHPALKRQYPWWSFNTYTFILCNPTANTQALAEKASTIADKYIADQQATYGTQQRYHIQPFTDIYLHSDLTHEMTALGDGFYVYLFSIIGILILLIACINFINISTARAIGRAKEVGLRKTLGAFRKQLVSQFFGEIFVAVFIAMLFALLLVEVTLPYFNDFSGKQLMLSILGDWQFSGGLLVLMFLVSLFAGAYPAISLSGLSSVRAIKGMKKSGKAAGRLRSALVIVQFAITAILISGTMIVQEQLTFMQQAKLGFEKERVLAVPVRAIPDIDERFETIREQFLATPAVNAASISSSVPGKNLGEIVYIPEGSNPSETQAIKTLIVDEQFLKTYGIRLAAGRNFSPDFATDPSSAFVINSAAVQHLGWGSPEAAIGKEITWGWPGKKGTVIGVTEDFHQVSLQTAISPILMHIQPSWYEYLSLKVNTTSVESTLQALESTWQALVPSRPFEYFFIDDFYNNLYQAEDRVGTIFNGFSTLAILIACLGLFGLAAFTNQQRVKEIGIRKTLGASLSSLIILLAKQFLLLVLIANLIAIPLAWSALSRWLDNFAYRTDIHWHIFLLSAAIAFFIALATIGWQTIRTALANPIGALRHE